MSKILLYNEATTGVTTGLSQYAFFINENGLPTVKSGSQVTTFGTSGYAMQGSSGSSGMNGTNGFSGTSGISGTSGQDGAPGDIGAAGSNGSSGMSGTSGINGIDGMSGTSGISYGTSGISGTSGVSLGAKSKAGSIPVTGFTYNATTGTYEYDVIFVEAYANTNYSISINLVDGTINNQQDPYSYYPTWTSEKTVSGFTINTLGDPSQYPNVTVEWMAISQGETGVAGSSGSSGQTGASGTSGVSGSSGTSAAGGGLTPATQKSLLPAIKGTPEGGRSWRTWVGVPGYSRSPIGVSGGSASYGIFALGEGEVINQLQFYIESASGVPGSTCWVSIYRLEKDANNEIYMSDRLVNCGTVSSETTGVKTITLGTPFTMGHEAYGAVGIVVGSSDSINISAWANVTWDGNGGIDPGLDGTVYRSTGLGISGSLTSSPTDLTSFTYGASTNASSCIYLLIR